MTTIRVERATQVKGEVNQYDFDFNAIAVRLGTSVSSADWSTEDTSVIGVGTESLSSNVASVDITASEEGCAMLKISATMADSQVFIRYIKIDVIDPKCVEKRSNDYWR